MRKGHNANTSNDLILVRKVSTLLNIDQEIADFYLFRFFKDWGKEGILAVAYYLSCLEDGSVVDEGGLLEYAFKVERSGGEVPFIIRKWRCRNEE